MCVSSPVVCWYVDFFFIEQNTSFAKIFFKVVLQESNVNILFAVLTHLYSQSSKYLVYKNFFL